MTLRQIVVRLLQATSLNRLAHRLYYRHAHGFQAATQPTTQGLEKAFALAAQCGALGRGDYYEFGLFKGYSFWWAQKMAARQGANGLRFFGFDSFAGLPEVEGPDRTRNDDFYRGQYACSLEQVKTSLEKAGGVDWSRTFLTKGYFSDTLQPALRERHAMRPVAIALIDCDLYSSTVDVLRFVEPLLVDGSVLVFDDWNCFQADPDRGQRKALSEFLADHPEWTAEQQFTYGSWGACFRMRRARRGARAPAVRKPAYAAFAGLQAFVEAWPGLHLPG